MAQNLPPALYLPLAAPAAVTIALNSSSPVLSLMATTLLVLRSTHSRAVGW